jgi:hypothetical protein
MQQGTVIRFLTMKWLKSKVILAEREQMYRDAAPALAR